MRTYRGGRSAVDIEPEVLDYVWNDISAEMLGPVPEPGSVEARQLEAARMNIVWRSVCIPFPTDPDDPLAGVECVRVFLPEDMIDKISRDAERARAKYDGIPAGEKPVCAPGDMNGIALDIAKQNIAHPRRYVSDGPGPRDERHLLLDDAFNAILHARAACTEAVPGLAGYTGWDIADDGPDPYKQVILHWEGCVVTASACGGGIAYALYIERTGIGRKLYDTDYVEFDDVPSDEQHAMLAQAEADLTELFISAVSTPTEIGEGRQTWPLASKLIPGYLLTDTQWVSEKQTAPVALCWPYQTVGSATIDVADLAKLQSERLHCYGFGGAGNLDEIVRFTDDEAAFRKHHRAPVPLDDGPAPVLLMKDVPLPETEDEYDED